MVKAMWGKAPLPLTSQTLGEGPQPPCSPDLWAAPLGTSQILCRACALFMAGGSQGRAAPCVAPTLLEPCPLLRAQLRAPTRGQQAVRVPGRDRVSRLAGGHACHILPAPSSAGLQATEPSCATSTPLQHWGLCPGTPIQRSPVPP